MNATEDPLELPDELSVDQFWEFYGRREHTGLDFKRGVNRGLLVAIPAMAMTSGGHVIHGVGDDRSIVGCPLTQRTQDKILRYAAECDVPVRVRSIRVNGLELTITCVPEITGRIVTTPDGRLVRRVGGDSMPLRGDALRRFVLARSEHPGEEEVLTHFDADDFDLDMINQALRAEGREPVGVAGMERALVDLRVAKPAQGTVPLRVFRAAAVLFCKDPAEYVSGATVQFVRRAGVGPGPVPTRRRAEMRGPLPRLLDDCLSMIAENTQRFEAVMGVKRETIPEYPTQVIREAVANALAHRDYGLVGATVDITVWDDRVEMTSPGPLPGHITPDNMQTEHYSRNRRIMGVLKTMGLVEEYGEGVDLMIRGMESRLMERPVFTANPDSVTVTLRSRAQVGVEDQVWLQLFADHAMTVEERLALVTARSEGSVTPRRLRALMAGADAGAVLVGTVAKGLLTRVGVRGGARYVLSDEVVLRAGSTGIQTRSRHQQLLLDEIGRLGSLSTVEGAELIGEQLGVVRNLLNDLVRAGLARAEGRTRARRYYPPH